MTVKQDPAFAALTTVAERYRQQAENAEAEIARLQAEIDRLRVRADAAEPLWDLLDDIDTASDVAKADNAAYRRMVEKVQRERFKYADSDGYSLTWKPALQEGKPA